MPRRLLQLYLGLIAYGVSMVLMLQSSNRENQDSLRLFRDRGDVHGFVPDDGEQGLHAELLARVPNLSTYDLGDGASPWPMVKASMGNAMRIVRPVRNATDGPLPCAILQTCMC